MKKAAAVLAFAMMLFAGAPGAEAVDFKVKGEWMFEFSYTDGLKFARDSRTPGAAARSARCGNGNGGDNFTAAQRVRLQLEAVVSESLMGELFFEIGDTNWGRAGGGPDGKGVGGALGTDGISVKVRRAYIDWFAPELPLRIRMGLQGLSLANYSFGSAVFDDDAAGIVAAWFFNRNIHLSLFWLRPFNDNFAGSANDGLWRGNITQSAGFMDNLDAFGITLPMTYDSFKLSPWFAFGFAGPNTLSTPNSAGDQAANVTAGISPAYWRTGTTYYGGGPAKINRDYFLAIWAGLSGEITAADPLRVAWDVNYGSLSYRETTYRNRAGWFANLLVEYKLDWGVPGIYGWYGSGDDADPKNGSERMPVFSINNTNLGLSSFGFNGGYYSAVSDGVSLGISYAGGWGIGARIRDLSFLEDLSHTVRVNFFGGTNDPAMAKYITGKKNWGNDGRASGQLWTDFNSTVNNAGLAGTYLTRMDYGVEINVDSVYKIYENLDMMVELGYIHLWLDQSRAVWGAGWAGGIPGGQTIRGVNVTDAVKAAVFFRYSF